MAPRRHPRLISPVPPLPNRPAVCPARPIKTTASGESSSASRINQWADAFPDRRHSLHRSRNRVSHQATYRGLSLPAAGALRLPVCLDLDGDGLRARQLLRNHLTVRSVSEGGREAPFLCSGVLASRSHDPKRGSAVPPLRGDAATPSITSGGFAVKTQDPGQIMGERGSSPSRAREQVAEWERNDRRRYRRDARESRHFRE